MLAQAQNPNDLIYWTAQWSPDGNYIAVGANQDILIFDGKTFEFLKKYNDGTHVERIRWHPNEPLLAIADDGPHTRIINIGTDEVQSFKSPADNPSRSVVWSPDGSMVANADYEGRLSIWKKDGTLVNSFTKENTKSYVAMDWHPLKDEIIVLSNDIRVYDLAGNLLKNAFHRDDEVLLLCVEWHPSGEFFVLGDYGIPNENLDPFLQWWDHSYEKQKTVNHSKAEYRNLDWHPDGSKFATASDALRIWSKEGKLRAVGPSSKDYLWGISWSPDGENIVTSSTKGKIQIWDAYGSLVSDLDWE